MDSGEVLGLKVEFAKKGDAFIFHAYGLKISACPFSHGGAGQKNASLS